MVRSKSGERKYCPERGDIVLLSFSPQVGHEQAGTRPALVLSPIAYNKLSGLTFCCPITRTRRNHPFEILLPKGMVTSGSILLEHLRSLDWQKRSAQFVESAPAAVVAEAVAKITAILIG